MTTGFLAKCLVRFYIGLYGWTSITVFLRRFSSSTFLLSSVTGTRFREPAGIVLSSKPQSESIRCRNQTTMVSFTRKSPSRLHLLLQVTCNRCCLVCALGASSTPYACCRNAVRTAASAAFPGDTPPPRGIYPPRLGGQSCIVVPNEYEQSALLQYTTTNVKVAKLHPISCISYARKARGYC